MAFPGTGKIWMNGSFVDWLEAKIHIASHVIHYGSGVFEGARCYDTKQGPACFRLDAHLRRLIDSAKIYRMDVPYDQQTLNDAVMETIQMNGFRACYIRPLVYRGYDSLGVHPGNCPIDVIIMVWEWGAYFTKEAIEEGLDVKVSTWARNAPNTTPAMAKSVANYANAQLIKMEAVADGYAEGNRARYGRQHQRRQRPERLHRPRRDHSHAPHRLVGPVGNYARLGHHHCPRPRLRGAGAGASTGNAVSGRRDLFRRYGRGSNADPVGGPHQGWPRPTGAGDRGGAAAILPDRAGRGARHLRLAAAGARGGHHCTGGRERPIDRAGVPGHTCTSTICSRSPWSAARPTFI